MPTCLFTGRTFEASAAEMALRKKLGVEGEPNILPAFRFLQLGAFWQHFHLHRRVCDKTGKSIVSPFGSECPYPVWHKDEWVKSANPPGSDFDPTRDVFPQMWDFFQKSPIPHSMGTGNENCEYTDDFWYSKNCYLSASGLKCEDCRYTYRCHDSRDCWYCVFSHQIELCTDLVNCQSCFQVTFALNSQQCRDSAFLFDCRNVENSLFCWNLRNKKYCYFNEQLTTDEFAKNNPVCDYSSRGVYEKARLEFGKILREKAWLKAVQVLNCEQVSGNYLSGLKNAENCYFVSGPAEDCINCMRGGDGLKDCLDCLNFMATELTYYSSGVQDQCYDVKFSNDLIQCKFAEYSAHCFQCQNIFGCSGLVGKKYYIFNKPYSPEEYAVLKAKMIAKMKETGEYGKFFPGYFAAQPYEESLSAYYFPLPKEVIKNYGFRVREKEEARESNYLALSQVPDRSDQAGEDVATKVFWDEVAMRPVRIDKADLMMAKKLNCPLPFSFHTRRLQENFRFMPFAGMLRKITCQQCGKEVSTGWSKEYDARILCEECYLKSVV